jgi:AraC-type DNA-binding domain-containing proteins
MIHFSEERFADSREFPFHISIDEFHMGEIAGLHEHEFTEMIYVSGGIGVHQCNGKNTVIKKGNVIVVQPGMMHAFNVAKGSYLKLYRIMFHQRLLDGEWATLNHASAYLDPYFIDPSVMKNETFLSCFALTSSQQFEMVLLLDRIYSEYTKKSWGYHCMIRMQLMEMFLYLGRWAAPGPRRGENHTAEKQDLYEEICTYVKQHYMQQISLKQICSYSGMSQSAFTLNFKKATGLSFIDYRNKVRIEAAEDLLVTTDLTVLMVAQKVGFSDVSNFNRTFKRFEGCTPLVYRKSRTVS